jgi:site-specific DNA-methyltransferase (adenine-specific)
MSRRRRLIDIDATAFDYSPFVYTGIREPYFRTHYGALWNDDCLKILPYIADETVDTVFADPPFNLGKSYGKNYTDKMKNDEYVKWCRKWLEECSRILKPGGALFVYNIPYWNILLGSILFELDLTFRHWIAIEFSASLPIPGKLHPSHYSLLYYSKGKPKTFRRIRTPIATCRHCGKEIKDYGGHRKALNPKGVSLKDVWTDIPPVRHSKFKNYEGRKANALSTKLLDRVVEMSTEEGDVVLDPFGGSGTTYAVCEVKHRKWLGMDVDFANVIADRLTSKDLAHHANGDVVDVD